MEVYDATGTQRDWAWLKAKYKCDMVAAPAGAAFRLVRIDETIGPATFIVDVRNANGGPQGGQPVAQWWNGVEADEKKVSLAGSGVKSAYHEWVLIERTAASGDVGFAYGPGGVIHETGGPYSFWVLSPSLPSDALTLAGWLGGTDHACPGRLTFQIAEAGTEPEPQPEPEPGSYTALLERIAAANERIAAAFEELNRRIWGAA